MQINFIFKSGLLKGEIMKKSILVIGVVCFLIVGTFGVSLARYWYSQPLTILSVSDCVRGVEIVVTYDGLATPKTYRTDAITPPANKNAILAIALTAFTSGTEVNLEFEGSSVLGIRFAY